MCQFISQVASSLSIPDHQAKDAFTFDSNLHHIIVEYLFGGFDNWDSQYYLTIAVNGYIEEQFLVFFPLYPFLIKTIAFTFFSPLLLIFPFHSVLLMSGYFLSNAAFMLSLIILCHLTAFVTSSYRLAWYTCLFYCINPANVFMCSVYTESLFSFFCLLGMLSLCNHKVTVSSILFAFAVCTRSNGVVTIGYIWYYHLASCWCNFRLTVYCSKISLQLLFLIAHTLITLFPFICFQYYSYYLVCVEHFDDSPVCNHTLPFVYAFIQKKYWEIELFSFYELKQIPNFIIAFPMVALLFKCCVSYFWNFSLDSYISYLRIFSEKSMKGTSVLVNRS